MSAALAFLLWSLGGIVALVGLAVLLVLIGVSVASKRAFAELKREADEKAARREKLTALRGQR